MGEAIVVICIIKKKFLNLLKKTCYNYGREKGSAVGASVRAEEDVDGGGALQAGQRPHQSQRPPAAPRRTQDVEAEAGGAAVAPRQRPLLRRRHPRQGQRRRAYRPSVCYPSSHFQVSRCLLSKVRRRSKLRPSSFLTIALFSSRIPGGPSRKSSEDPE